VNLPNFRTVMRFTRVVVFIMAFFVQVTVKGWEVDFSRRNKDLQKSRGPGSVSAEEKQPNLLDSVFTSVEPTQDIVILNTEKGFVPETVKLKKGQNYRFMVVNVDEKEKNASFILESFSEHHGTYFGQPKAFNLSPKVDGIYSFVSPETGHQGKIIVFSDERKPAAE
jgi:hypothetical protein